MTKIEQTEAKQKAKQIFNSLTSAQKNHLQDLFNAKKYWQRRGIRKQSKIYDEKIFTIQEFLTAGEASGVWSAFDMLLYDYNIERYNQEQKPTDDLLLSK